MFLVIIPTSFTTGIQKVIFFPFFFKIFFSPPKAIIYGEILSNTHSCELKMWRAESIIEGPCEGEKL